MLRLQSVKTKASQLDIERCIYTADTVVGIIESYIHEHKVRVFVEAIPFSRNPNGKLFTRHELVGMIKYRLRKLNAEVYFIQSKTLKLQFTGNGSADKAAMQATAYNRYVRLIKNDNIADALALCAVGHDFIYEKKRLPHERLPMD